MKEYFKAGAKWTTAPKPTMADEMSYIYAAVVGFGAVYMMWRKELHSRSKENSSQ